MISPELVSNWSQCWVDERDLKSFADEETLKTFSKEKRKFYLERVALISIIVLGLITMVAGALSLTIQFSEISIIGLNSLTAIPLYGTALLLTGGLIIISLAVIFHLKSKRGENFKKIEENTISNGLSNFQGWAADTIYQSIDTKSEPSEKTVFIRSKNWYKWISPTLIKGLNKNSKAHWVVETYLIPLSNKKIPASKIKDWALNSKNAGKNTEKNTV